MDLVYRIVLSQVTILSKKYLKHWRACSDPFWSCIRLIPWIILCAVKCHGLAYPTIRNDIWFNVYFGNCCCNARIIFTSKSLVSKPIITDNIYIQDHRLIRYLFYH